MTKKVRENFFFLIISNIITLSLVIVFYIIFHGAEPTMSVRELLQPSVSMPGILMYLFCAVLACASITLIRANRHINEEIDTCTNLHLNTIRMHHLKLVEEELAKTHLSIRYYVCSVMSPYLDDENLDNVCQNIRMFGMADYEMKPIIGNEKLSVLDLGHFAWNIGEQLGWSGLERANFIKSCFPTELKELEVESIRRNLRRRGKCIIELTTTLESLESN